MGKRTIYDKINIENGQSKQVKNGATYFKYSILLACFLIGAWMWRGCECNKKQVQIAPVVKIDTFWKKQDSFISYVPKPYKVTVPVKLEVPTNNDELTLKLANRDALLELAHDSLEVLRDYLATRYYDDSFKVDYGVVRIQDTVFTNAIVGRGVKTRFNVPIITKTVTIEAQKRNVVMVGVDIMGNQTYPLYATGASVGLHTKTDKEYKARAMLLKDGSPIYGFGVGMPIKLKRRR